MSPVLVEYNFPPITATGPSGPPQCPPSGLASLERTRFFARQLVGPDDLTQDQLYFREKLRRHNRLLHGWGIVCGAGVRPKPGDKTGCVAEVQPGYILGPYGDEILIEDTLTIDLCHETMNGDALDPCAGVDPWCSDVQAERPEGETLYLAVRYEECPTRPVRVYGCGCGCDEAECEYSRLLDSYVIRVLHELPESHSDMTPPSRRLGAACAGAVTPCPECAKEPWVLLCGFSLKEGKIASLKCDPYRRYALTAAHQFYTCATAGSTGTSTSISPWGAGGTVSSTSNALVDSSAPAGEQPRALALARLPGGGWASVPINFEPRANETYAELAAREGARELTEPESGATVTVSDVLALAGVDPQAKVGSVEDLRNRLDGVELAVDDLSAARAELDKVYSAEGRERRREDPLDAPAEALALPASLLEGGSELGDRISDMSVADVADAERDSFVSTAIKGSRGDEREALEERARELWERARRARDTVERFGGGG